MKNFILLSAFFLAGWHPNTIAQTLTGGCDSVYVTSTPASEQNAYFVNVGWKQCGGPIPCCRTITSGGPATPRFFLQKKLDSGSWTQIGGQQFSPLFDNLDHGTYRVRMNLPVVDWNHCGGGIPTSCYNTLGQFIGHWGTWSTQDIFTNEVIVGNTTANDIGYTFIDIPETGPELAYDFGEVARINTSASKNYNIWWLAIFENGSIYNRYQANGWTNGKVPNDEFNLSLLWATNGWNFETFHTYTVQFVVENRDCPNTQQWNNLDRTFFICPAGSGCRFNMGEREVIVSPNPASSVIRLQNFEPDPGRGYHMIISDLTGKIVKTVILTNNEVGISDLQSGIFIVSILSGNKQVFTSKLVVNQ